MSDDIDAQQEILFEALRLDQNKTGQPWQGKVIKNPKTGEYRCELRKEIKGSNMLIVVGETNHDVRWVKTDGADIRLSSNGRMYLNEDQFSEMVVAIKEARLVLNHVEQEQQSAWA